MLAHILVLLSDGVPPEDPLQRLKSIDLFAGAGGMTEGFRQTGIDALFATDYDEMAGKTFLHNHPDVPFVCKSVEELKIQEILDAAGTSRGQIDVVCGGPPCQGFSLLGPRMTDDPRNQLFKEFVRIVDGVQPKFLVFENVVGLVSMQSGKVLAAIQSEFARIGYTTAPYVLNAADFGVPQARPRVIILGSSDGRELPPPPVSHGASKTQRELFEGALEPHITVWQALSDLPVIDQGEGAEVMPHEGGYDNGYQAARRGHRQPGLIFNHRATAHSPAIQARYLAIPEGQTNVTLPPELRTKKVNVFKLHRDRPARTVTCNHRTDLLHPVIPRGTTVREAARLQSFDDDYQFFGNLTRKARWVTQDDQVGNAVPPLLAKAIAKHLIAQNANKEVADAA